MFQGVEEATRQGVILPILAQLGWNTYNIREVSPEYNVGNGRVDYCLRIGEKKVVYIEVKRLLEELERHERQLLEYSFKDGVDLAILTNGLLWWFYFPLGGGTWQQRRFFTIDLQEQDLQKAITHFQELLSRSAISNGTALTKAKAFHTSKEKARLINEAMPRAWNELFSEPDEAFIVLFGNKVESMCGYNPDPEIIAQFIREHNGTYIPEVKIPVIKPIISKPIIGLPKTPSSISTNNKQHGARVRIHDKVFGAQTVPDLYNQVLRYLVDNKFINALEPYIPFATSNVRYLLARHPIHPRGNRFVIPIEYKGYFMEAHKDYHNAINHLKNLLNKIEMSVEEIS